MSDDSSHSHHVLPLKTMLAVYGALLVLTVITWAVAQVDLGAMAIVVALAVAGTKASLVALYFMQLKWDNRVNTMVFLSGVTFLVILLGLTLIDTTVRGPEPAPDAPTEQQTTTATDTTAAGSGSQSH